MSLFSRLTSSVRGALSAVRGAVSRGLDTLGVTSLLQRVGLAAPPAPPDPPAPSPDRFLSLQDLEYAESARRLAQGRWERERREHEALVGAVLQVEKNAQATTPYWQSLDPERVPDERVFAAALGRIRRKYAYIVKIRSVSDRTGEITERHVTVASDRILTPGEVLDQAQDMEGNYGETFVSASVEYAMRASDLGTME